MHNLTKLLKGKSAVHFSIKNLRNKFLLWCCCCFNFEMASLLLFFCNTSRDSRRIKKRRFWSLKKEKNSCMQMHASFTKKCRYKNEIRWNQDVKRGKIFFFNFHMKHFKDYWQISYLGPLNWLFQSLLGQIWPCSYCKRQSKVFSQRRLKQGTFSGKKGRLLFAQSRKRTLSHLATVAEKWMSVLKK